MSNRGIVASSLTKAYGRCRAVGPISFAAGPGRVTVLAGPSGSGKTTTLRMIVGLVRPSNGSASINGLSYAELPDPLRLVGTVLESASGYPGHTGVDHLRAVQVAAGLPESRIGDVIALAGLDGIARHRLRRWPGDLLQRLAVAVAMLGDPGVVVVDDVALGMDAAGEAWILALLRRLAREGRTVLVATRTATHLDQLPDDVVLLERGHLVDQWSVRSTADRATRAGVS